MKEKRIVAVATVSLEAASGESKRPTLSIVAYNGDAIIPHYYDAPAPVVFDLAGLSASSGLPILLDHDRNRIVGQFDQVAITQGKSGNVVITGKITGDTEDKNDPAGLIMLHSRNGFSWRASVGLDFTGDAIERIGPKKRVVVNGRTFTGPLNVLRRGLIAEVSLLSVPADSDAVVKIAANSTSTNTAKHSASRSTKGKNMPEDFHSWLKAQGIDPVGVGDEHRHQLHAEYHSELRSTMGESDYRAFASDQTLSHWRGLPSTIRADASVGESFASAMSGSTSVADFVRDCQSAKMRSASGPADNRLCYSSSPDRRNGNGTGNRNTDILACAALMLTGNSATAEKSYNAEVLSRADSLGVRSAMDLCAASLRLHGMTPPSGANSLIQASLGPSTGDLSVALGDSASKVSAETYLSTPATWRAWCKPRSVSSFRAHKGIRGFLGNGGYALVAPGGELQHATVNEEVFEHTAQTRGRLFSVDRTHIVNDDLGIIFDLFRELGREGARSVSDTVYTTLTSNPNDFFHTDNDNLLAGSGSALRMAPIAQWQTDTSEGFRGISSIGWRISDSNRPPVLLPAVRGQGLRNAHGTDDLAVKARARYLGQWFFQRLPRRAYRT